MLRLQRHAGEPRVALPLVPTAEDPTRLPAAHVITAEFDILRDSGEAYANRLLNSGVAATIRRHDGHIHGSPTLYRRWEPAQAWLNEIVDTINVAFDGPIEKSGFHLRRLG